MTALRRFGTVLRRRPSVIAGIAILAACALVAVIVPAVSPYQPDAAAVADRMQAPSASHPLGTDDFGRDSLARLAVGIGMSMQVALATSLIALILGLILGLVAVFVRPLDQLIMRICDGLLAIPGVLLALAVVAATGASVVSLVACLVVVETPGIVRLVRSAALSVRERPYVEAAHAAGVRPVAVVMRHVLPSVSVPVAVQASAVFGSAIIIEAALSFLGAGIPAPTASLGNMLSDSKAFLHTAWWLPLFPGVALAALVLGANLIGDGIGSSGMFRLRRLGRRLESTPPAPAGSDELERERMLLP